jgi:hypothetical protein
MDELHNYNWHMIQHDLEITDGAVAGAWIRPRLGGKFGAVTGQVPEGFEAYARVFHPALNQQGHSVSWGEVAKICGTTPHRQMQWHAILGLRNIDQLRVSDRPGRDGGVKWAGSDPPIGTMDIKTLDALCEILADHTSAAHCFFGLCTIRGWLDFLSTEKLPPLLELPYDRNHMVLIGPLSAVDQIVDDWSKSGSMEMTLVAGQSKQKPERGPSGFLRRDAPNLIWPADDSWFVASEIDFDSTLVGGSSMLINAIVDSPKLEAWQVEPADSLADDADKVNRATQA